MEGSLVAYKVFTNGSVLNASEINDNLMNQSVPVFTNAAARTAAITSPVEGQLSYLEDTNRYGMWSGSSWISPLGLTPIISQTIGTGVSSVTVSNVFTTEFDAYKIILTDTLHGANSNNFFMKLNNSNGNTYYSILTYYVYATGASTNQNSNASGSGWQLALTNTQSMNVEAEIFSPALAKYTTYRASGASIGLPSTSIGLDGNAVAHTGFTLSSTTTMTGGTIRVYGYKKD